MKPEVNWKLPNQVLVTGAAGFIGSRFVERMNDRHESVISVDHPAHFFSRTELQSVDFGPIVDREHLIDFLNRHRPKLKAIVHLGACTDTTELNEAFLKRVNIDYSKALWKYATEQRIPFIYASSAATYGDGSLGYDDDEERISDLKPLNPYGESKRLFDLWALHEELNGSCPPAWSGFKFFNVYGFGERHKGKMASVILHAFDQIQRTGRVKLFRSHKEGIADGYQMRDFVSVKDVVQVLEFAMDKPLKRGIYNLGTGRARPFIDLVQAVFKELGLPPAIDFIDTPVELRARYQYFTEANMTKLREAGYTAPFQSLESGVADYIEKLK